MMPCVLYIPSNCSSWRSVGRNQASYRRDVIVSPCRFVIQETQVRESMPEMVPPHAVEKAKTSTEQPAFIHAVFPLILHLDILRLWCGRDPENVVTPVTASAIAIKYDNIGGSPPNQHLSKTSSTLAIHKLLCSRKLEVHVAVDTDERALVLGLSPLQADDDGLVDSRDTGSCQHCE